MFKNEEGFSLLELVVAVGVAGIIAAVALPTFAGLQDKASQTSATYAASASAAEALANSTIGTSGSVNSGASSSTTSSSSSSSVPSTPLNVINFATDTDPTALANGAGQFYIYNDGYGNHTLILNHLINAKANYLLENIKMLSGYISVVEINGNIYTARDVVDYGSSYPTSRSIGLKIDNWGGTPYQNDVLGSGSQDITITFISK